MSLHEATGLLTRWDGTVGSSAPRSSPSRWRVDERRVVFVVAAVSYVALSVYLLLYEHAIFGDALSRVGNAQYVVDSRDPHLAAVGFVWNPLPSLALVPFVPLRWLWPAAVSTGFIGGVESALFMAGAVALVRGTLQDLGLGRIARLVLTAGFAVHPEILVFAYNGMSEAPLIFFSLLATRSLISWLRHGTTRPLMMTGIALSFGYLTRYEALASGTAVIALVGLVSLWRAEGSWVQRRTSALTDVGIVGLPFAFTFVMWALLSRIIVRQWFPTLSSEYGNTAQVTAKRSGIDSVMGRTPSARLDYLAHQMVGLEPLLVVIVVLALLAAALRRDLRVLAPLAVIGAVLAFDVLVGVKGTSFGWLRYEIVEIPLAVIAAGCLVATAGPRWWLRGIAGLAAAAMVLPAVPLSMTTIFDKHLGQEESRILTAVVLPDRATEQQRHERDKFDLGAVMARDLDRMDLGHGAVVTDAAFSFPLLVATRHPKAFVITPDQDFMRVLADPVLFHARYLLVPDPRAVPADAVVVAYPTLYDQGWPGGKLVRSWPGVGGPSWRLYQLP